MDLAGAVNALIASFVMWLPKLLIVVATLIVGFIIAIILQNITQGALRGLGLDRKLATSPGNNIVRKLTDSPSYTIARFVYWLAVIITITIAISVMNVPVFNQFLIGVYGYVPNILASILILALALAVSTAISGLIIRLMGDTATGKVVSVAVPVVILSIAGFAILEQLKIAPAIVIITYTAIIGSLALGFALAFGLGGVETSRRLFDQAYQMGKNNYGQIKKDIEKGKERGKEQAEDVKKKMDEENK